MKSTQIKETSYHSEKVVAPDQSGMVATLQNRVDELIKENEVLRQKTQVVVKKVETNVIERKAGLDQETVQHITDLENRLSQAELLNAQRYTEIETLQTRVVKFTDLQSEFDVVRNRNQHLELQLTEKLEEFQAFRVRYDELNSLYVQDKDLLAIKERELLELHKRLQELERLPIQIEAATKNAQLLSAEVDRLSVLAKERDSELIIIRKKVKEVESQACLAPGEHEELRVRVNQVANLEGELSDLKGKYTTLCTQYENEIKIVRAKEKEINQVTKELHQNIKESRKALDKELSREEKLEKEIEALLLRLQEKEAELDDWKSRASLVPGLQDKIKSLESDYLKLQEKYKKLEEVNAQYKAKADSLLVELDNIREHLKNKEKAFNALEKEKTLLVAEFEKSQKESSAMLARVTDNKNLEIESLNSKIGALSRQLSEMHKEIESLKTECDRLNAEKVRISKVLEEHVAQEKALFAKVEAYKKEKDLLSNEIAALVAQKEKLKGIASTKDKEVHQLDKEIHGVSKENQHLHDKIAQLENQLASFNLLIQERDVEIKTLKTNLHSVSAAHADLVKERERLVTENTTLYSRVTDLESSYTTVTTKYNKLEKIYNEIRSATAHLGDVHDKLVETCEETEKVSHMDEVTTHQKTKVKQTEVQKKVTH